VKTICELILCTKPQNHFGYPAFWNSIVLSLNSFQGVWRNGFFFAPQFEYHASDAFVCVLLAIVVPFNVCPEIFVARLLHARNVVQNYIVKVIAMFNEFECKTNNVLHNINGAEINF
jgi:hypothetical protein